MPQAKSPLRTTMKALIAPAVIAAAVAALRKFPGDGTPAAFSARRFPGGGTPTVTGKQRRFPADGTP
ncbi:hypothetical protein OG462_40410 [Streptomyces sp. NBC_01077]|uniref:hypothetical protein n=1 Tax=Streptomyces sp. NBC_01077 TaxID=2903746 RepID=UPI0038640571|nr:hypothetical protein OG462_40410 [Streptomyces sp. NBC_01077]